MIKDFKLRDRFILSKRVFGLGFIFELKPVCTTVEVNWLLKIDLIWIRFWIESINDCKTINTSKKHKWR